jgi:hypothetical protein
MCLAPGQVAPRYGVPALAGGALARSGALKVSKAIMLACLLQPKGGTPFVYATLAPALALNAYQPIGAGRLPAIGSVLETHGRRRSLLFHSRLADRYLETRDATGAAISIGGLLRDCDARNSCSRRKEGAQTERRGQRTRAPRPRGPIEPSPRPRPNPRSIAGAKSLMPSGAAWWVCRARAANGNRHVALRGGILQMRCRLRW